MTQFPRARPTRGPRRSRPAPPVHVFVPSGSWTSTVVPQEICRECGNAFSHRTHDRRPPEEIYTPVDSRKIGEGE